MTERPISKLADLLGQGKRTCGSCDACCVIPAVKGKAIDKPAYMPCSFIKTQGAKKICAIHKSPDRPEMCKKFVCAWLFGYGSMFDNPVYSGVMASINEINGETAIHVFELKEAALKTTGSAIISDIVRETKLPVVITNYDKKPGEVAAWQ